MEDNPFALSYSVDYNKDRFIVLLNANRESSREFKLPEGDWDVLVNSETAGTESLGTVNTKAKLQPSTGMVLKKK